ncbi:VanZ family protein [Nocardioides albidus]|uniref:VanZ family protein n=1 Tax=Nocardioides albidus TaxID=1517589 RepID=A0A5C4W7P0_9ACTN|nr:VanZ family protein [Nocardioides albidus]TNM44178.1 VanZ family protein [Nocardioides albidus]
MKPLRLPGLWLGAWLVLVAAVVVLSLGSPPPGPDVPAGDKWQHLLTYATLSAAAVQVFRPGRPLQRVAVGLVLLGVALEIAQGTLTADRMMDWRDAVANAAGVGLGLLTTRTRARDLLVHAVPSRA